MEVNKLNKNNFQRNFIFRFFVFLAVVLVTIGGGFAVTSGDVQIEGGDNYSTIQAAINAAQDGDTILVGPGVYDESFIVNKELNLIGTNNPVINGKIELNSNNIIIDGLKINGTDRGVEFYHNLDHITVRNSFISDTTTGIYINPTTANNITIFNNNITNTVAAIGGDSYEGISIIQNNLYNNQEGVGYSDSLSRNGPLLEDNNFSNNQIQVKDYSLSTIDMNAVFSNNIFDKAILTSDSILSSIQAAINAAQDGDTIFVGAGVYEENLNIPNNLNNLKLLGSNYGISSNSTRNQETIIKGYLRTGSGQSNWPNNFTFDGFSLLSNGDRAIIFRIQGDVNIKNNIIDQNESGQNQLYAIGFVAHSAGTNLLNLNFENNTLRNSRNGLYVDYTPTKGNIENNIFENIGSNPSFNEGSAIFSRSHINSINGNIFNNTGRGINFHPNHNTSTTVIDNLFEETNIYVRDNSGLIDLSSTFSNNQFAEQSIILDGNSIVPTTLVSIYNIDTNAGYSSIQNAINAANEGETILVEEGIYEETIDINVNNLTLISSSGAELTTIIGGSASSSASSATVRITTNNIILDGFTIDNLNNQAGSISGGNNAANVTIQNNIITNSQRGVRSDYYGKFGDSLMIYNNTFFELTRAITNTEDIPSLYVINNSFINININAVSFGSGIEDISIEGNSFENVGGRSITVWQDVVLSSGITLESILSSNLFDTSAGFSNGFNSEFIVVTSTISQAIVEAGDGDTILVGEGIYEESLTILKNLSLVATGNNENTIIDAMGATNAIEIGEFNKNGIHPYNVEISGFTVINWTDRGIAQRNGNTTMTITNNIVKAIEAGSRNNAIVVSGGNGTLIHNNFVESFSWTNPDWSSSPILLMGTFNAVVTNNTVTGADQCIAVVGAQNWLNLDENWVESRNNSVVNNSVSNCGTGISIGGDVKYTLIETNTLLNNEVGVSKFISIYEGTPMNNSVINNYFGNNQIHFRDTTGQDVNTSKKFNNNEFDKGIPTSNSIVSSIQDAIDAANEGDTILVGAGVYTESINININNLTLTSIEGASNTTIEGQVSFMSDNSKLDGFTVIGPDGDTRAIAPRSSINTTISNNIIENSRRAIQGDYNGVPTNLMIINNTLNTQFGVAGTEDMKGLVIEKNLFQTSVEGIGLGDGVEFRNNVSVEELYDLNNWNLTGGFSIKDYREGGATIIGEGGSIEDILINTQENSSIILIKYNQTFNATIKNTSLVSNITFGSGLFINTSNYNKILVGEMNSVNVANELENSLNKYFKIEGLVSSSSGESQIKFPLSQLPNNLIESSITFKRFNETSDVWDIVPTFIDNGYIVANVTGFSLWGLSAQTQPTPPTGGGGGGGSWTTPIATEDEEEVEETPTTPVEEEDSQTGTGIDTTVEEEEEITQIEEDTTQDTSTGQDEQTTVDETTTETTVDEQAPGLGGFIAANAPTIAGVIAGLFIILAVVGYFIFGRS